MRRPAPAPAAPPSPSPAPSPSPSPTPSLVLALVLLALLVSAQTQTSGEKDYSGWRVLRAKPASAEQLRHLEALVRALGAEGASELWRRRPAADVLVRPDVADLVLRFMDARGIPASVHVADVGEEIRRERSLEPRRRGSGPPNILQKYLRYDEINDFLDDLQRRYPQLVKVSTYGQSYEGRDLKVAQISTGGDGQRPVVLIDAGIHAREWIAPAMALYIIHQLVENPSNAYLLQHVDWHIIPLLNPDGYEFSHTTDRMWRKTRSVTDVPNCLGADPNRNFDFFWGVVGVSWDPCKETYAGHEPFSEVEAEALAMYGMRLRGSLRLYVSIHSYGGVLIHPWGYSRQKPSDASKLVSLGQEVVDAIRAAGIPRFDVGNCFEMLGELAAGGSDDWMKGVAGANFSFTLEMPVPSFTTPALHIERYVVPTFEGFRVLGRFVSDAFGCC